MVAQLSLFFELLLKEFRRQCLALYSFYSKAFKVGRKTATELLQIKEKKGLQAGGRGGGGKLRKFQGPINVLTCEGVQEKG